MASGPSRLHSHTESINPEKYTGTKQSKVTGTQRYVETHVRVAQ